jgi:outer membrane protein assembly factor BamB
VINACAVSNAARRVTIARRSIFAALLAGLLAACGGSKGLEPSPLPQFEPKIGARLAWRATAGKAGIFIFSPAQSNGMVCAAGGNDRLSCFSSDNGRRMWVRRAGVSFSGGVGGGENMLLLGTSKGEVLAYDLSGTLLWRSRVSTEVLSAPTGSRSIVVVRAGDSKVFGLSAKDGTPRWEYEANRQPLILRSNPGMAILDDSAVISGFPGGRMVKLDVRDGALLWDIAVATPRGDNELERLTDVAGTPILENGWVCAVAFQGRVGCFDSEKGAQIWARSGSSAGSLVADTKTVYYTEDDGVIVALDKSTGASLWRQDQLLYRRVSAPVVVGDWIVVGDFEGYVHVLSREDGSFVAQLPTDGSAIVAAPLEVKNRALVQTQAGSLYMIALEKRG